jgi:hypothetical protein
MIKGEKKQRKMIRERVRRITAGGRESERIMGGRNG